MVPGLLAIRNLLDAWRTSEAQGLRLLTCYNYRKLVVAASDRPGLQHGQVGPLVALFGKIRLRLEKRHLRPPDSSSAVSAIRCKPQSSRDASGLLGSYDLKTSGISGLSPLLQPTGEPGTGEASPALLLTQLLWNSHAFPRWTERALVLRRQV